MSKTRISNILKELDRRLTRDDEARIMHHVKKLPQYKDFHELYEKTVPVCARFEKRVFGQQIECEKLTHIVGQFDANLTLKASAHEVKELWAHCDKTYALKSNNTDFVDKVERKLDEAGEDIAVKIEQFDQNMEALKKHIKVELKNAKAALMPSAFDEDNEGGGGGPVKPGGGSSVSLALQRKLDKKADKAELDEFFNQKASKNDTELSLRWVEIVHKQLKQVAVLISEYFRSAVEPADTSKHSKVNRDVGLLQQSLLIFKWIADSEVPHVRDAFELETVDRNLPVPPTLLAWEARIKSKVSLATEGDKLPNLELSPDRTGVNTQIMQSLSNLYGKDSYRAGDFGKKRRPGAIGTGLNFQGSMPNSTRFTSPMNVNFRSKNRSSIAPSGSSNPFITLNPDVSHENRIGLGARRNTSVMKANSSFQGENLVLPAV